MKDLLLSVPPCIGLFQVSWYMWSLPGSQLPIWITIVGVVYWFIKVDRQQAACCEPVPFIYVNSRKNSILLLDDCVLTERWQLSRWALDCAFHIRIQIKLRNYSKRRQHWKADWVGFELRREASRDWEATIFQVKPHPDLKLSLQIQARI